MIFADKLIALGMKSPSRLCVIPMQDHLGIGAEGRMNRPSSPSGNWSWRMKRQDISTETADKIRIFTELGGRASANK